MQVCAYPTPALPRVTSINWISSENELATGALPLFTSSQETVATVLELNPDAFCGLRSGKPELLTMVLTVPPTMFPPPVNEMA